MIRSGALSLGTEDPLGFKIAGDGFLFSGADFDLPNLGEEFGQFRSCCTPGQPVNMSAHVTDPGSGVGAQFGGATYAQVFWSGQLDFVAPSVVMPAFGTTDLLSAPFTMSGTLSAFLTPDFTGAPLFSANLTGQGRVDTGLLGPFQNGTQGVGDISYTFASASPTPTPEPASLLLLGLGICGMAVAHRRRPWRVRWCSPDR